MATEAPLVNLAGITKRYGAIVACNDVDLALHRGEIHGVLGENGAGKSTLMKILIGLVLPDAGTVAVAGSEVDITDPAVAADLGIGMVHQHFSLVDALTVWENVVLGERSRLDRASARARVTEIGGRYGLDVDPDAKVSDLSAGQRQRVEIIKCLRRDPKVLVFDEPTSVLTPAESEQLFGVLRRVVQEEGRAVALVSHKLDEILRATDQVTIMRSGRVVQAMRTSAADAPALARAMVGREVSLRAEAAALGLLDAGDDAGGSDGTTGGDGTGGDAHHSAGPATSLPVLRIVDATARSREGALVLDHLSLEVRAGEIVGVAGVEGNGQRALTDLLSSLLPLERGTVELDGAAVAPAVPGGMHGAGIGVIPEDRHDSGCVLDMTVAENLVLAEPGLGSRFGLLNAKAMLVRARELIGEFEIQCQGPDAPMWSLSGGNQQRVVLARELSANPKVLVAAQPTRGLDVGAIEYMGARLKQAAERGVAILLVSTELEEILALADRIVVLYRGRIVGEMDRASVDIERLGLLMGGAAA